MKQKEIIQPKGLNSYMLSVYAVPGNTDKSDTWVVIAMHNSSTIIKKLNIK